jgi:hypothetical protein
MAFYGIPPVISCSIRCLYPVNPANPVILSKKAPLGAKHSAFPEENEFCTKKRSFQQSAANFASENTKQASDLRRSLA